MRGAEEAVSCPHPHAQPLAHPHLLAHALAGGQLGAQGGEEAQLGEAAVHSLGGGAIEGHHVWREVGGRGALVWVVGWLAGWLGGPGRGSASSRRTFCRAPTWRHVRAPPPPAYHPPARADAPHTRAHSPPTGLPGPPRCDLCGSPAKPGAEGAGAGGGMASTTWGAASGAGAGVSPSVEARTTTQRAARDERVEGRAAKPAAGRRAQVGAMASMGGAGVWAGGGEGVRGRGWWVGGWERGRDCGGSGGNRSLLCRRVAGAAWGSARATRGGVCIFCPRSHTQQFAVFAGSCTTFAHCSGTQG